MIDRAKQIVASVDAWLQRHRRTRIARRAVTGFLQHEALQSAGSMAYFSILSIFQLLVLGVVVMTFFVGEGEARQFIIEQIQAGTPVDPETIGSVIDGVIESRGGISLFGIVFLVWGALGIFSAVSKGIGSAFAATQLRPFIQDKLLGLLLMTITGLLGIASVAIGILTGIIQDASRDVLEGIPGGGLAVAAVGFAAPIILIFVAFLVLYRLVPNRRVTLNEVWPGALVATILWTVLRIGFTWYTTSIANYDSAFGPISAAISLLVFLYFASVIVLLGAEVARASVVENEEAERAARAATEVPPGARAGQALTQVAQRRSWLPGWSLAIGSALAAILVRFLSARRGGKPRI